MYTYTHVRYIYYCYYIHQFFNVCLFVFFIPSSPSFTCTFFILSSLYMYRYQKSTPEYLVNSAILKKLFQTKVSKDTFNIRYDNIRLTLGPLKWH